MVKNFLMLTAAAGLLVAVNAGAMAQNSAAPGQQMQDKGSVPGSPGASGYAPGQQMKAKGPVQGTTGASGYAPRHTTTGSSVKGDVDMKGGGGKGRNK